MIWGIPKSKGGNVIRKTFRLMFCILFMSSILAACTSKVEALPTLDAKEITSLGNNCKIFLTEIVDLNNSKDIEKISTFFTDDIIVLDGYPMWVGMDGIIAMYKAVFSYSPPVQSKANETYISEDECFGSELDWSIFRFPQDDPGMGFSLLQIRDGKISFWRQMYDQHFLGAIGFGDIHYDFLSQFVSSWSGGYIDKIMKIYADNAKLEDNLFGITVSG
jgi:hypothetical protein